MAIDLSALFGQQPDYSQFISPAETQRMQSGAGQQALLNAAIALLGQSGQTRQPISTGQILGSALGAGMEGYNQSFDRNLKQMLTSMQLGEIKRKQQAELLKQQEAQQLKSIITGGATPKYGTAEAIIPTETYEDVKTTVPKLVGFDYDLQKIIPQLQATGNFGAIKDISESMTALRKAGFMSGDTQAPSPFAPYIMSENPQVKTLATQLQTAFNKGVITEEQAYQRLQPLAQMETNYLQSRTSAEEKAAKAAEGKKPTEGERNAAGFAQRMEASEQMINKLENKIATQQMGAGKVQMGDAKKVSEPYATGYTQFMGGIPLVGEYARTRVMTPEQQQYRQAQENWVRANLRKESGAAIGAEEMDKEIATYFPMPNNDAATIQQKKVAREVTMDSMKKAAGVAYQPFNLETFKKEKGLQ
jgi:prolyl-tRNA editing enzyme YbaK/EbsC (Cys-tRNA(Pro) deacylase)